MSKGLTLYGIELNNEETIIINNQAFDKMTVIAMKALKDLRDKDSKEINDIERKISKLKLEILKYFGGVPFVKEYIDLVTEQSLSLCLRVYVKGFSDMQSAIFKELTLDEPIKEVI